MSPQQMSRIVAKVDEPNDVSVTMARQGEVFTLTGRKVENFLKSKEGTRGSYQNGVSVGSSRGEDQGRNDDKDDVMTASALVGNLGRELVHDRRQRNQQLKHEQHLKWHEFDALEKTICYLKSSEPSKSKLDHRLEQDRLESRSGCRTEGSNQALQHGESQNFAARNSFRNEGYQKHNGTETHEVQTSWIPPRHVPDNLVQIIGEKENGFLTSTDENNILHNRLQEEIERHQYQPNLLKQLDAERQMALLASGDNNQATFGGASVKKHSKGQQHSVEETLPVLSTQLESSLYTTINSSKDSGAAGHHILLASMPKVIDDSYSVGRRTTFNYKTRISVNKPSSLVSFVGLGLVGLFSCLCYSVHGMDSLAVTPTCFLPPSKTLSNRMVYVHRRLHVKHPEIHEDDSPKISQGQRRQLVGWSIAIIPSLLLGRAAFALLPDEAGRSYDAYAKNYDVLDGGQAANILGIDEARSSLFGQARGDVLEIGAGTGLNLDKYDTSKISSITLVDISEGMLQESKKRLESLDAFNSIPVKFVKADATSELVQKFDAKSFDT